MVKSDFIKALSEETGFARKDLDVVLAAITKIVVETLKDKDSVNLGDLGKFSVAETSAKPERQGVNPKTREPLTIKAKDASFKPVFKFAKKVKEDIL